jgi:general stress protein 26
MADLEKTRTHPEQQLWEELEDVRAGMLGVEGAGQHLQPMAPQLDPEGKRIWFFTKQSSDLVQTVGAGKRAHFAIVGEDHDYHACLAGQLMVNKDRERIQTYWNTVVAAWFNGKDDPELTMLEFQLSDAMVWAWASSSNPVAFGWEIVKSNLTSGEPDVGVRTHIGFQPHLDRTQA